MAQLTSFELIDYVEIVISFGGQFRIFSLFSMKIVIDIVIGSYWKIFIRIEINFVRWSLFVSKDHI